MSQTNWIIFLKNLHIKWNRFSETTFYIFIWGNTKAWVNRGLTLSDLTARSLSHKKPAHYQVTLTQLVLDNDLWTWWSDTLYKLEKLQSSELKNSWKKNPQILTYNWHWNCKMWLSNTTSSCTIYAANGISVTNKIVYTKSTKTITWTIQPVQT